MKYSIKTMMSRDIYWFFETNSIYVHAASFGAILPKKMQDKTKLRQIQKIVNELPIIFKEDEIVFNENFIKDRMKYYNDASESNRLDYIMSFFTFAQKGFVSMDRWNFEDDPNKPLYKVVCMPKLQKKLEVEGMPIIMTNIKKFEIEDHYDLNYIINE